MSDQVTICFPNSKVIRKTFAQLKEYFNTFLIMISKNGIYISQQDRLERLLCSLFISEEDIGSITFNDKKDDQVTLLISVDINKLTRLLEHEGSTKKNTNQASSEEMTWTVKKVKTTTDDTVEVVEWQLHIQEEGIPLQSVEWVNESYVNDSIIYKNLFPDVETESKTSAPIDWISIYSNQFQNTVNKTALINQSTASLTLDFGNHKTQFERYSKLASSSNSSNASVVATTLGNVIPEAEAKTPDNESSIASSNDEQSKGSAKALTYYDSMCLSNISFNSNIYLTKQYFERHELPLDEMIATILCAQPITMWLYLSSHDKETYSSCVRVTNTKNGDVQVVGRPTVHMRYIKVIKELYRDWYKNNYSRKFTYNISHADPDYFNPPLPLHSISDEEMKYIVETYVAAAPGKLGEPRKYPCLYPFKNVQCLPIKIHMGYLLMAVVVPEEVWKKSNGGWTCPLTTPLLFSVNDKIYVETREWFLLNCPGKHHLELGYNAIKKDMLCQFDEETMLPTEKMHQFMKDTREKLRKIIETAKQHTMCTQ